MSDRDDMIPSFGAHDGADDVLRPEWTSDGHVDEGTIHAWIDGAFDTAAHAEVAAHVETCAHCARAVAEARGFVAGAARVVRALDGVPRGVVPQDDAARAASRIIAAARDEAPRVSVTTTMRRPWYASAAWRAAAALVVVVGGGGLVYSRTSGNDVLVTRVAETMDSASVDASVDASREASREAAAAAPLPSPSPSTLSSAAAPVVPPSSTPVNERDLSASRESMAKRSRGADVATAQSVVASAPAMGAASAPPAGSGASANAAASAADASPPAAKAAPVMPAAPAVVVAAPAPTAERRAMSDAVGAVVASPRAAAMRVRADEAVTTRMIRGTVVSASGVPVDNAGVIVVASTNGVTTDASGAFALRVSRDSVELMIRRIGYEVVKVPVPAARDTAPLRVVMRAGTQTLSAVTTTSVPSAAGATSSARRALAPRGVQDAACWQLQGVIARRAEQPLDAQASVRALSAEGLGRDDRITAQWINWPTTGRTVSMSLARAGNGYSGQARIDNVMWRAALEQRGASWRVVFTPDTSVSTGTTAAAIATQSYELLVATTDVCKS